MNPAPRILGLVALLGACGARVVDGDDGDSSSGAGETTGDTSPSTTTATATTSSTTTEPMTSDVSTAADSSTSESSGAVDTSTGDDTSTGEPIGTCSGLSQYGSIATVLRHDGTTLEDPPCNAAPAPCGGDVLGMWHPVTSCGFEMYENVYAELCAGAEFQVTSLAQTGTIEFFADNHYGQSFETTLGYSVLLDALACFGLTCAGFEAVLGADADASCGGPDDQCSCAVSVVDAEAVEGTYAIVDQSLLLTADGQDAFPIPYCVSGDRLDLWSPLLHTTVTETACAEPIDCEIALGDRFEAYVCVDDAG